MVLILNLTKIFKDVFECAIAIIKEGVQPQYSNIMIKLQNSSIDLNYL